MKRIQIFRAGRHTSNAGDQITFSEADLGAIAGNYDPALHEAPIVVGHPRHDAPAYGWAKGLVAEGGNLYVDPHQVSAQFAELVEAGRFKKISPAVYRPDQKGNPKPGQWYLRHIGFLGAQPPAVKGLAPVQFADDEEFVEFGELDAQTVAGMFRRLREFFIEKFGADDANKALPDWDVNFLQNQSVQPDPETQAPPSPIPASFSETEEKTMPDPDLKQRTAELDAREAELTAREAALKTQAAEFSEAESEQRRQGHAAFLDSLVAEGKPLPASKDALVAFMESLAGQDAPVEFSEEGGKKSVEPLAFFKAVLGKLAKQVEFAEFAPGTGRVDPTDPVAIAGFARAWQAEQAAKGIDISIDAAVRHVTGR
ncbi:MAG: hypothetical protein IT565_09605 [Rhodospirillales bacterium]|nr:hypothetical protein [Rhodospirillales bacterium]